MEEDDREGDIKEEEEEDIKEEEGDIKEEEEDVSWREEDAEYSWCDEIDQQVFYFFFIYLLISRTRGVFLGIGGCL